MLTGFAHVGVCVPDVVAATRWYCDVLGLEVLSPPYRMAGEAIERDMGELVPSPVVLKASIVGCGAGDHVLELIEYPEAPTPLAAQPGGASITRPGLTHVGLLCDDLDRTRAELEGRGVEFLTSGVADVAGLRTTWCVDPWGTVIILLEKKSPSLPYWRQFEA
jgi:catechol 2,3-dioxygenase-like lactoylglutathione lyase family enzyme